MAYKEKQDYLITENNFIVAIGKNTRISFSKITNLAQEAESENVLVGGENQGVRIFAKQNTKEGTLVLERGVLMNAKGNTNELKNFRAGRYLGKTLHIYVINKKEKEQILHSYYIEDGFIRKWELSKLDAMSNEILIEKLEIVHSGLIYEH